VNIATPADARIARTLPFPVVNITAYLENPGVTTVTADHEEMGRMAATHLLERRFQRFGYYGSKDLYFSRLRREGFISTVRVQGAECTVLEVPSRVTSARSWMRQEKQLEQWLRSLRPPAAIMTSTDLRADTLIETCRKIGLRVPEDIAVVGVDNDPVIVGHAQPPLTSIARNDRLAGELAAQQLARLMAGHCDRREMILVPPAGVVARQSTETLAVEDTELAALVHHIRGHIRENFGVERLIRLTGWSRRALENRCYTHLGESPYAMINRLRIEQAKRLLETTTKLSMQSVAEASGFSNVRHFRMVFNRLLGKTPAQFWRELKKET
jgi:LacI family transcriptional regulator